MLQTHHIIESDLVHIHVPTYRNEHIFSMCLDTWLDQTHSNIRINVYDNSLAEGFTGIRDICKSKNDGRIIYVPNAINIGATENYKQIFRAIGKSDAAIVLPADYGLACDAVASMLDKMHRHQCLAVFGGGKTFRISGTTSDTGGGKIGEAPCELTRRFSEERICSGIELIQEFYADGNISGELSSFSFAGPLIQGTVYSSLSKDTQLFRYHGFEQLFTMRILLRLKRICLSSDIYYLCVVGQERLGDTKRPKSHLTRLEPILAAEQFVDENHLVLSECGLDITDLRKIQIKKTLYYMSHYAGFETVLIGVFLKNCARYIVGRMSKILFWIFQKMSAGVSALSPSWKQRMESHQE